MAARAGYNQISYYQRLHLKEMLDAGYSKIKMAEKLEVSKGTIYNEIKRGTVDGVYDPDYAESRYRENKAKGGARNLFESNKRLAEYVSKLILAEHLSPQRIVERLEQEKRFEEYPSSMVTIYTAIDNGLIPGVTREDLCEETDVTKVYNDGIHFPKWLMERMRIHNGDKYRFMYRANGDIILKKIKGER